MTTTSATPEAAAQQSPGQHEVIARAVLRNGPQVLLARMLDQNFWFLPGVRVPFGESATRSLRRELEEELALGVRIGDLLGIAENFYSRDGETHHELNLVFDVRIDGHVDHSHQPQVELQWFTMDRLETMDIRPPALASIVRYGPGTSRMRLLNDGLPR